MKISEITEFLEQAYNALNQHFFCGELPPVIITVQSSPRVYGHYTPWDAWREQEQGYREINLGAENLDRPIQNVASTLLHEMVHFHNDLNQIKDVSRGGTYHNKRFKEQAEAHGLTIDYDSRIGYSVTSPSPALIDFIEVQGWQGVNLARQGTLSVTGGKGGRVSSARKYQYPDCGCSVRATKAVLIIQNNLFEDFGLNAINTRARCFQFGHDFFKVF